MVLLGLEPDTDSQGMASSARAEWMRSIGSPARCLHTFSWRGHLRDERTGLADRELQSTGNSHILPTVRLACRWEKRSTTGQYLWPAELQEPAVARPATREDNTMKMRLSMKRALTALAAGALVAGCAGGGDDGSTAATDGGNSPSDAGATAGGNDGSESEPAGDMDPLRIVAVIDETGPAGFAGAPSRQGVELAVEEINAAGGVAGREIVVDFMDSGTDPTVATNAVQSAVADDDVDAIIYGVIGSTAVGLAPFAQNAGVPLVLLQATVQEAIQTGDYVFRTSYSQTDYTANVLDYWEAEGVESISIIAHEDSASGMQVVNDFFVPEAESRGFNVNPLHLVRTTDTDYTSTVQDIISEDPDAVYNQILGTPIVTIIQSLRNVGYEGYIGASVATAGGVLSPLGDLADGVVYPTSFSYATDVPAAVDFVEAFEAAYGERPGNFAADGYDGLRLIAAGAQQAGSGSLTRESLQQGMLAVTQEGLSGSPTADPLEFEGRAATGRGVLVSWEGGEETVVDLD